MRRYILVWLGFLRASLVAELEFRANISAKILSDVFWYVAQIMTFHVLYQHTETLGGWTVDQMRVFMSILFLVDALYMMIFSENLDTLGTKVLKGELDFLLTKPINAQFVASCYRVNCAYLLNISITLVLLFWSMSHLPGGVPWLRLPVLFMALLGGLMVMYLSKLIFALSAIFFGANSALGMVWFQFYRLATRPDVIYPRMFRYIVLTIVPMGFIASVPARLVVTEFSPWFAVSAALVGIMAWWMSQKYWTFAMTRYSSASS